MTMHIFRHSFDQRARPRAPAARLALLLSSALVAGGSAIAWGAEPSGGQDSRDASAAQLKLAPVVVTGTRSEQSSFELPLSIDVVGKQQVQSEQPQVNLSESLVRVPGLVVNNRQNYAQDLQISSRGFGSRATFGVRGVRLYQDGVPATMPDGQGQSANFDLSSAARIEVLKGPFSAIYGNASGGVIQLFTEDGPPIPTLTVSGLAGSYGTRRTGIKFGGQAQALNYTGDLSRFDTDGYREHSAARRDQANLKLRQTFGSDSSLTFLANTLDQPNTQDPLGLTQQQVDEDPRQAGTGAIQFNTRKNIRHRQAGAVYEHELSARNTIRVMAYGGHRAVEQYLPFAGTAPTSSGGVVSLDRDFGGTDLRWVHKTQLSSAPFTLTAGIDYDRMNELRRGYVNNDGIAGALQRNENDIVYDFDQYVQGEWKFAPRWLLLAGLRNNRVRFDSRDHFITALNPDDSGGVTYTRTNPMAGITFRLTPAVNLYANAGTGFETPTFAELAYKPDGTSGLNFDLRPSKSRNYEVGVKSLIGENTLLNASVFHIDTRDEIVSGPSIAPGRSTYVNAARTTRNGFEASLDTSFGHGLTGYISYSYIDAKYEDFVNSSGSDLSGNNMPGVPRNTVYGQLSWRYAPFGFATTADVFYGDKLYANDTNTAAADAYTVVNWRAGFEQHAGRWQVKEFVNVNNVLDRNYVGSVIVNGSGDRYFEPAPRRNYIVGAHISRTF